MHIKEGKNYYMQKADIERRRRGNKDILQLTDCAVFFLFLGGGRGIAGEMQKYRSADVGHTPHRPRPDKEGGRPLGPQLRSLPAILARGLRIRPAHSPFPPTLNWLVDKSPTLSGGGGGGIGKSTMRRCRRSDKGGRPATGFLQAGARPADRSPKVQGYCSCQSVKLLVSRFSRAGA